MIPNNEGDAEPHRWSFCVQARKPTTYITIQHPNDEESLWGIASMQNSQAEARAEENARVLVAANDNDKLEEVVEEAVQPVVESNTTSNTGSEFILPTQEESWRSNEGDSLQGAAGSSNINPDLENLETVPLKTVSLRKQKKLRGSSDTFYFFESMGSGAIRSPPALTTQKNGLQTCDLFVHRSPSGSQAWICNSCDPAPQWTQMTKTEEYDVGLSGPKRIFVFTDTGLPSFVTEDTINRAYKQKLTAQRSTAPPSVSSAPVFNREQRTGDKGKRKS